MPRYVIERSYTVDEAEVPVVATRSKRIARDDYPEITWEHSHVVLDLDGTPKSFCIYEAPSEEVVRQHAVLLGDHFVETIHAVNLHAPFDALTRNLDEIRNLVQAISTQDARVSLAAEHDDRRAIAERAVHGSESIHRPWPHVYGRHTWLARGAGITVGHVGPALFMHHRDQADAGWSSEDRFDIGDLQRAAVLCPRQRRFGRLLRECDSSGGQEWNRHAASKRHLREPRATVHGWPRMGKRSCEKLGSRCA